MSMNVNKIDNFFQYIADNANINRAFDSAAWSVLVLVNKYSSMCSVFTIARTIVTHHDEICESLFHTIVNDNNHRLYKLLPAPHQTTYSVRHARLFNIPRLKTNRFKNGFDISSCLKASKL